MIAYHAWLERKVTQAMDNFEKRRGFRPPRYNQSHGKREYPTYIPEVAKPFNRRRIVFEALHRCEQIFSVYGEALVEPVPEHNRSAFEEWMDWANHRYEQATRLMVKLDAPRSETWNGEFSF